MKCKRIIQISLFVLIFIFASNISQGLTTQTILFENETISITPQFGIISCEENLTTIFRIERLNYTENNTPLDISYTQSFLFNEIIIIEKNISKTINKYTTSNTGEVFTNTSGEYELQFNLNSQNLVWFINSSCGQSLVNESNETIVVEEEIVCFQDVEIIASNRLFSPGEKIYMDFMIYPRPDNFSITYWIEDLFGTVVKNQVITTNTNTKTYTFKEFDDYEKTYTIKAIFEDSCQEKELYALATVKNEDFIEKEIEEIVIEEKENFEITNRYTKQKYMKDNLTWYVRVDGKGPLTITVVYNNQTKIIHETFEKEKTISVVFENPVPEGQITTVVEQEEEQNVVVDYIILKEEGKEDKEINEENEKEVKVSENKLLTVNTSLIIHEKNEEEKENVVVVDTTTQKVKKLTIFLIIGLVCCGICVTVAFTHKKIKEFIRSRKL